MTGDVRIVIVEDHPIIAAGLQALLDDHDGYTVAGVASTMAEGLDIARRERPRVAIVDYRLPDGTGAELASALRAACPDTAVIILTAEAGDDALLDSASAGATGYVRKSEAPSRLVRAIDSVLSGGNALPVQELARALQADRLRQQERRELDSVRSSLTPRELEILTLMARGRDNRAIAAELTVGYTTVRSHVQNIIEKLGARSRLEAVARATDLGIIGVER
jgi:DNA-binding NarL/FixJ family response regulator